MSSRSQEYMRDYMKTYIAASKTIQCEECGGHYKSYRKYKHMASKKYLGGEKIFNKTLKELQDKMNNLENLVLARQIEIK